MKSNAIIDAVSTLLGSDEKKWSSDHFPGCEVRISISNTTDREVVIKRRIQRDTPPLFQVTLGRQSDGQLSRSRNFLELAEAADLFFDASIAQLVGFNLGGDENAIFDRFDPLPGFPSLTPMRPDIKQWIETYAKDCERMAHLYMDQAAKARREASELP